MDEFQVKEVMDQIHIPPKMQEEILGNVEKRMAHGNKKTRGWNFRKMAAAADGFSREYSDREKERSKELWQDYENGIFPEQAIAQVDSEEEAPEGALCYIKSTGYFHLPTQEMTDEEMLQIIDFQHKMSYAVSNGPEAQAAREEAQAEEARIAETLQDEDGISEDEAIAIAEKQLKEDYGETADKLQLRTYGDGSHTTLTDDAVFAKAYGFESRAGMIYDVGFEDPETQDAYGYLIDAVDGRILCTFSPRE